MKTAIRIILIIFGFLLLLLLVGPFLVPVPPLEGTVAPAELADPDSRFIEINNLTLHYKEMGEGEPVFLLLHGFGASVFSWREVMAPLAAEGRVIAFDRPAFGLTERPMEWGSENPYSPKAQVALAVGLLDNLGIEQAIWVGNSAGGTVSMNAALAHPERVQALVLVDPAVYAGGGAPSWIRPLLGTPQMQRLGPRFVRSIGESGMDTIRRAWHDPTLITDEMLEGYRLPLRAENWDRALWYFTTASRESELVPRLQELTMPTLVVTGDDDRIVPTEQSIRLAGELPNAELVVFPNCGHVPQEECPQAFLEAVLGFVRETVGK
jgi:pimeloyl-ACP methyl ester carboxylesterase